MLSRGKKGTPGEEGRVKKAKSRRATPVVLDRLYGMSICVKIGSYDQPDRLDLAASAHLRMWLFGNIGDERSVDDFPFLLSLSGLSPEPGLSTSPVSRSSS